VFATISDRLTRGKPTDDAVEERDASGAKAQPLRLDHQLPDYHAVVRRHRVVDAPVEETYDAMLSVDLTDLGPLVGALGALRAVPIRVGAWFRGAAEPEPESISFGDLPSRGAWVRLDAVDGEEFVFGAVGTVWRPDIEWVDLDADEFRAFDGPGYAKIAAGFSFHPYGRGRTLVTYEARTAGTDATAERRFGRYWRLVCPFVGYILGRVLAAIAVEAERNSRSVA
jgi:hypothetical protein